VPEASAVARRDGEEECADQHRETMCLHPADGVGGRPEDGAERTGAPEVTREPERHLHSTHAGEEAAVDDQQRTTATDVAIVSWADVGGSAGTARALIASPTHHRSG
jgi:hypothetical protein